MSDAAALMAAHADIVAVMREAHAAVATGGPLTDAQVDALAHLGREIKRMEELGLDWAAALDDEDEV